MTEYHFDHQTARTTTTNEAKEQRRKVLDRVFQRRRLNYKRYNLRKIQEYYQHRKNSPEFD